MSELGGRGRGRHRNKLAESRFVTSAAWKAEQKNLVERHERLKEKQGEVMGVKPKRQVSVMRQLGK